LANLRDLGDQGVAPFRTPLPHEFRGKQHTFITYGNAGTGEHSTDIATWLSAKGAFRIFEIIHAATLCPLLSSGAILAKEQKMNYTLTANN
jgi:hypothetical protein